MTKKRSICPSLNVFPVLFPAFGPRCLNHLEAEGLSLDNLFGQFVFRQDERDMVLKAVCSVRPEYQPASDYLTPDDRHPSLVQDLYLQVPSPLAVSQLLTRGGKADEYLQVQSPLAVSQLLTRGG